jgi:hypothetical protein
MASLVCTARRVLAVAAATGAAALALTAASATGAGAASQAVAPECATSALEVWIGLGGGESAAGSTYYPLEFSNTSHRTCDLYGFPGVSAVRGSKQAGSAAARDHAFAPRTVVLAPGGTAHALLQIANAGVFSGAACKPVQADALRVYPPDRRTATLVPFSFEACQKSGPVFLHIRTIRAGVGIPGYSQ